MILLVYQIILGGINVSPFLIVIILIALILLVIFIAKSILTSNYDSNNDDTELYEAENDYAYRRYIYNNVSTPAKPHIDQIFQTIDNINKMVEQYNANYDQARYNAMKNIFDTANQAEAKIKRCWNNAQFNKDFSFYIGLHYASHMLGMAIKSEQFKVRDTFVMCKNKRDQEGEIIDKLKRQQEKCSKNQKFEIGKEIAARCKKHKQISILTSQIGKINSQYLERATQQNIETAKRRDYIASHFGKRGIEWKRRMRMRALLNN